jgi:rhomboid protease GluP
MHAGRMNLLEAVLRLCAESAPRPWYPRAYAADSGVDADALSDAVEEVWLERLVERAGGSKEEGAGFVLSRLGERVLRDPEALGRLREGRPVVEGDAGAVVRHSLRRPARPVVSRVLLAANLLVFGYGLYLAAVRAGVGSQLAQDFLVGFVPPARQNLVLKILHETGAVQGPDLLRGEWWRLLSAAFVHLGLLHLGMNMYALVNAGGFVEQTWGRLRFLAVYALSAWGGGCLGMAYAPVQVIAGRDIPVAQMGASGALFGVFGAEVAWVLLYGRHLPRSLRRRAWRGVVINVALLAFTSYLLSKYLSHWGHLGGALTGAAAALVLHGQRFGPRGWRWLAPAALVPLAWAPWAVLRREEARSPQWAKLIEKEEVRDFEQRFLARESPTRVSRIMNEANQAYRQQVPGLLGMHPTRRDPDRVKAAVAVLGEQRRNLERLAEALRGAGPYRSETAEEARRTALEYTEARGEWYAEAERCLKAGPKCTRKDEERLRELAQKTVKQRERWEALLEK